MNSTSRVTLAVAAGVALAAVAATPALAAEVDIKPGKTGVFPTYFFGRSTICVRNLGDIPGYFEARTDAGYFAWRQVPAAGEVCLTAGWAGYGVLVKNTGQTALNSRNVGL